MILGPKYYRARLIAIRDFAANAREENKRWYQYGFIPEFDQRSFDSYTANRIDAQSNDPLSFTELTTYSTWFAMHPEKVAGKMQRGTSLYFPVVVKGTRQDVNNLIQTALHNSDDSSELELMEMEADALLLELKMKS